MILSVFYCEGVVQGVVKLKNNNVVSLDTRFGGSGDMFDPLEDEVDERQSDEHPFVTDCLSIWEGMSNGIRKLPHSILTAIVVLIGVIVAVITVKIR